MGGITEHGSAPAAVHATGTSGTTGSFSPPAGSLLVVELAVDGTAGTSTTATVSDSGSHTWTLKKRQNTTSASAPVIGGSAEVWECQLTTAPGSITITGDWSANGAAGGNIVTKVLQGAATDQTGAATGGTGGGNVAPTATLTPTQIGSRIYGACLDYATNATLTANANSTVIDQFIDSSNGDTWAGFKSNADTTSLSSTAYGMSNANSAFNTAAVEILAAPDVGAAPVAIAPGRNSPGGLWSLLPGAVDLFSVSLTDTGTGDDSALAVTATVPLTDTGAGDDSALTVTATVPLTDTGAGADSVAVVGADAGPGLPQPIAPGRNSPGGLWSLLPGAVDLFSAPLTDTGTGTDALSVAVTLAVSDTGSASDSLTALASLALAESANALESLASPAAVPLPETASASDAISVDTGGGTHRDLTDTGAGRDRIHVLCLRPNTATTTRPNTGTTARPDNGITYYQ